MCPVTDFFARTGLFDFGQAGVAKRGIWAFWEGYGGLEGQGEGRMWKEKKRNEGMGRSEWWREAFVWREWVDSFKMTNRHALSSFEVLNGYLKHLEIINHK